MDFFSGELGAFGSSYPDLWLTNERAYLTKDGLRWPGLSERTQKRKSSGKKGGRLDTHGKIFRGDFVV